MTRVRRGRHWPPGPQAFLLTLAFNSVTIAALSAGSRRTKLLWVAVPIIIGFNGWLHRRLQPYRISARKSLIGLSAFVMITGAATAGAWKFRGWPDGIGYLGLIAAFFGLGQLLVVLRYDPRWVRRAPPLGWSCAAVFLFGLLVVTVEGSAWGLALMALGVALGPVALGLLSERRLPSQPNCPPAFGRPPSRTAAWQGALLWVTSAGFLVVVCNVPAAIAFGIAAVVFLAVWAFTSNLVLDGIGIAVAIAIVWSGAPRSVGPLMELEPARGDQVIVAVGDSFMSGEGAPHFFAGTNHRGGDHRNECRRAPSAYVVRAVEASDGSRYPRKLVFLACSGAKAEHLYRRAQYNGEPVDNPNGGLDQLSAWRHRRDLLGLQADAVVVSIGGNDALFGDIGRACVGPGGCPELGGFWLEHLRRTSSSVEGAYTAIGATFPGIPVVVVPYPIPLRATACEWSALSDGEHRFLSGYTQELNKVLRAAAGRHGFHYLAAMEDALGPPHALRLCDRSDPGHVGVNFFAAHPVEGVLVEKMNPRNWFHNSLHPNELGHRRMSEVLVEWLVSPTRRKPVLLAGNDVEVATVESIMGSDRFVHCAKAESGPPSCRSTTDQWVLAQVARATWYGLLPFLALVAGAWAVSLQIVRWWRLRGTADSEGDDHTRTWPRHQQSSAERPAVGTRVN